MSNPASEAACFEVPVLEHVLTVHAAVAPALVMGQTPHGKRRVIPISGGSFEGRDMRGIVMPGGVDWQLLRADGVSELDARYWLQTDDAAVIRVHNRVLMAPPAPGAQPAVRSSVQFEAPLGNYDWLNKSVFIGTLAWDRERRPTVVTLRFFRVL